MSDALSKLLLEHDEVADLDPAARRLELRRLLAEDPECSLSLTEVIDHVDGFGPLTSVMRDPDVTDVIVNGPDEVWVERAGTLQRTGTRFPGESVLRSFVDRWLGEAGAAADISNPIADARLRDGSRLHVVLPPISSVPLVSIRRLPTRAPALEELMGRGMLTDEQAAQLSSAVSARRSIAISGATGSGKTTLLSSLLACISETERVVLLEETREVPISTPNIVSLVTRGPNADGAGAIDLADLVRASLRMRPDRIVVGEVRGAEALAMLAAMNTGQQGSLVTVHASSAPQVTDRMVALALQGSTSLGEDAIRSWAANAWDLRIHLDRAEGRRCVREVREG